MTGAISRLEALRMAVLSYAKGNVGDAAAYKSAILRVHAYPEVAAGLAELRQPLPAIDLEVLRALPQGTLGREYAVHMDRERLRPLDLSENARHRLWDHVLGLRYTLLHDLFHVLLGFDTSLPGELGVWEFVGAQRYSPQFERAARLAGRLYPVVAPHQHATFRLNSERAKRLSTNARCVIAHDFSKDWVRPLDAVRADLGLVNENGAEPTK